LLGFLLLIAGIGLSSPGARAQQEQAGQAETLKPQPLFQLPQDGGSGDPQKPAADPAASPDLPKIQGIEVDALDAMNPESVGILTPGADGLSLGIWQGSDRDAVSRLLRRLPGRTLSPALYGLAHRLLLTAAAAPGDRTGVAPTGDPVALLRARLEALLAIGDLSGLRGLLGVVPQGHDDEVIARVRVQAELLAGSEQEACRIVRNSVGIYHDSGFWPKALVFCQFLSGEGDQAELGLGLLREQGGEDHAAFITLADRYAGLDGETIAAPDIDVLNFAMMRGLDLPLPADLAAVAPPGLWTAIAGAANADLESRALAAERAVAAGQLEGTALADIYRAFSFEASDFENPIARASGLSAQQAHALLFQAAERESLPVIRAEVMRVAYATARSEGSYLAAARALEPMLLDLPVVSELNWFAETAGRAAYALGRYDRAAAWLRLALREAAVLPEAADMALALWPLARLAGRGQPAGTADLAAWQAAHAPRDAEAAPRELLLLFASFQALGESDPLTWVDLAAAGGAAGSAPLAPAAVSALAEAGAAGRVGETLLLTLLLLGGSDAGERHPLALASALTALEQVGMDDEARALAMESAIAAGI
jgi:hypothetical protein